MSVSYPTPPGGNTFLNRLRADATRRVVHRMSDWAQRQISRRLQQARGRMFAEAEGPTRRKVPKASYPQNKMVKGMYSTINAQAGRASVRMTGKKVKVKARRAVKVSKNLREKVTKVIAGKDCYGEYITRTGAAIGYIDIGSTATGTEVGLPIMRDTSYAYAVWANPLTAGSKIWWAGVCNNNNTLGVLADNYSGAFVYFSPLKILNAASILFNQKAVNEDWTLTAGNFSLVTPVATATPQVGSTSFPLAGAMNVYVHNSYVHWRIKNISQRSYRIKIYHCVSKLKFQDVSPLTCLKNVAANILDDATNRASWIGLANGASGPTGLITHPMFEPKKYPPFATAWKYDCTEINLKPGEEMVHTIQGPKNYNLDYTKLNPDGTTEIGSFFKDTTKCCMVSVELDAAWMTDGAFNDAGQWFNRTTPQAVNRLQNPISIEVDEIYKLSCPKNTGFISRALAAGTIQTLNLQSDRHVYVNFNSAPTAAQTYTTFNEEQPGSGIGESATN